MDFPQRKKVLVFRELPADQLARIEAVHGYKMAELATTNLLQALAGERPSAAYKL